LITLDNWQAEFLEVKGDKILCSGRQVGKSEICAIDAGEYAVNNPKSKPIVMVAPLEKQAFSLFSKTLAFLQEKYPHMICKGKDRPTQSKIKLKTGVEIYCLPVGISGLNIRFLTIGRLYIDEASRVPDEVFTAIEPALLTTGGAQIWLSTLNGAQGRFYECWINKDLAYNSFKRFSITSEEAVQNREVSLTWTQEQREKAIEKLEQARKRMSKAEYAQEYLAVAMLSLKRVFSDDLIKQCCILKRSQIAKKNRLYLGCDVGGVGEDQTTIEIIEKIGDNFNHRENIIMTKVYTTDTSNRIILLTKEFNLRQLGIDDGGLGFGVFSELLNNDITKKKVKALNNSSRHLDADGEKSKRLLKEDMYMLTLSMMEQGRLKLLDDDELIDSLKSVQYDLDMKTEENSRLRIVGTNTHITEGLIRAVWLAHEDKTLNIWVGYTNNGV
jgi:hypothetical protein